MSTRILAPVVAVLAIGGAVALAGDNDLIPTANAGSFELSVGQLKINQRISAAAVRRANKNRSDIADLQSRLGAPVGSGGGAAPSSSGSGVSTSGSATTTDGGSSSSGAADAREGGDPGDDGSESRPLVDLHRAVLDTQKVMANYTFGELPTQTSLTAVATCPGEYELVGGGHAVGAKVTGDPLARVSGPAGMSSKSWKVTVQRAPAAWAAGSAQETKGVRAWAVCARMKYVGPVVVDG